MKRINLSALERKVLKELQAGITDLRTIAKNLSINTKNATSLSYFKTAYCNLAAAGLAIRHRGVNGYLILITDEGKQIQL